jgi:hypothetical protein
LFQGYKKTLKETLEKASLADNKVVHALLWTEIIADKSLTQRLNLIELTKPWLLADTLQKELDSVSGDELTAVCNAILEKAEVSLLPTLEKRITLIKDVADNKKLADTIKSLKSINKQAESLEQINILLVSKSWEDRVLAAKLIWASTNNAIKKDLTFLLRDLVPAVKRQAIWASRATRSKEVISFLIDFLDKDFYAPLAHAALINSGETGLEMLVVAFNRTNASVAFQNRILRIIPDTGSVLAPNTLFSKLSVHSNLKTTALEGLLRLNFMPDDHDQVALHQMIIEQAGVCAWNLNIVYHCPAESRAAGLKDELEENYSLSRHNLFQLLKLQYDKSSIDAVIENLEAGTGESISFAIELLDTFVSEDLKPYIFPLLEDASLANKVWALQNYYPLRSYSSEEMLKAIINRNENLITKTAKIYALNAFLSVEDLSISADLAAQLFNSDKILRQLSAQIISKVDQYKYLGYKRRLNDRLRVELDRLMEMSESIGSNALDRLVFYRNHSPFDKSLAPLFWLYQASVIRLTNTNIFDLGIFKNSNHILLIESGELAHYKENKLVKTYIAGDFLVTKGLDPSLNALSAHESAIVHAIDYSKFSAEFYDNDFLVEYLSF